jgi:phospholipid/cholesterol/gamma-HCH transport system substrate-binding protein
VRTLLQRFEHRPGLHRAHPVRDGLIVFALFAFALVYMFTDGRILPLSRGGTLVRAEFANAANVEIPTTPIRVHGVNVGKVEKVERRPGGGVIVTMRVNEKGFRLRRDARANIYWRTLLGFQFYIELDPGSDPRSLGDRTIPESHTTTQVELDQVLSAIDAPSRTSIRGTLRAFDDGFASPAAPGRTLDALAPAMRRIAPGLDALRGTGAGDLSETVRNTSRLTDALARNEAALGGLVDGADTTLAVTAARRADMAGILRDAPATLADTRSTMVRLGGTLDALDPVAAQLRPGARRLDDAARALRPALAELRPLLAHAHPLLTDLRPTLARLDGAAKAGTPLLAGLEPTLRRTRDTLLPWLDTTDKETRIKNYEAVGPVFAAVSSSAQQFDANGHTQRFQAVSGSGRSLSFLPCHVDFPSSSPFDCSDVEKVVSGLLGAPPPPQGKGR